MQSRIQEDDIALVRERARIDTVVGEYVQLRNAGSGSLKGLCPFHDEKTPSFTVTPAKGLYYCFGCGAGGSVFTFLQEHLNLSFVEAVEQLADRFGVELHRTEQEGVGQPPGLRKRIMAANAAAADFYARQLASPEALPARQFLDQRGFSRQAAEHFHLGYAPRHGRALGEHLRGLGFDPQTLKAAGLMRDNGRDFFAGRLLWPIKDSGSSVLGFGGRRIFEDDWLPAKYINTPETPVYKKSHVLYGLDLARRAIGRRSQAVVVEGYTDVMAAHLAGVDTAVASCGTAFGDDHARLLQRLIGSTDGLHGEVIFTFDGDAAGQKAALKVFQGDQNFISQTYVAVEPTGLDPCDLRLQGGDAAVRELVGRRIPLYTFVMHNVVKGYDLDRADGRLGALREAAGLLDSIRDRSLASQYIRELAVMLGMDIEEVRAEVSRRPGQHADAVRTSQTPRSNPHWPDPADLSLRLERDTCKLMLQYPTLFDVTWNQVAPTDFSHPGYAAICRLIQATPLTNEWETDLKRNAPNELTTQLLISLLVEPVLREPSERYVTMHTARLRVAGVTRQISDCKSKLQRTDPLKNPDSYREQFERLTELEILRKKLQTTGMS